MPRRGNGSACPTWRPSTAGWTDTSNLQADSDIPRAPQLLLARATRGYQAAVLGAGAIARLRGVGVDDIEREFREAGVVPDPLEPSDDPLPVVALNDDELDELLENGPDRRESPVRFRRLAAAQGPERARDSDPRRRSGARPPVKQQNGWRPAPRPRAGLQERRIRSPRRPGIHPPRTYPRHPRPSPHRCRRREPSVPKRQRELSPAEDDRATSSD